MRISITRGAAALLCVLGFCAFPAMPRAQEAAAGYGVPRPLLFEVSDYRDAGGKHWIRLACDFECLYPRRMETIVSTLWDFEGSPKIFSRIEAVRVRSETGTTSVTEQRTAVRVLGLAFISELVFGNAIVRRGPGAATVSFETIETDGSCLSTKGAWELEERSGLPSPSTYVRFHFESYIEPRFPGQAAIMRGFGAGDIKRTMRELGQAMGRS